MFKTFLTSHPKRLLESAWHGFYHGMMEDVLNDESDVIGLVLRENCKSKQMTEQMSR
jgi:hypothetical protein